MSESRAVSKKSLQALIKAPAVETRINELMGKRAAQFTSAVISVSKLPHLKECTPQSLLGACMTAATLDLSINPNMGQAYPVPYNKQQPDGSWAKEAQFQMGYKGFVQLALRSGQYKRFTAIVINQAAFISWNPVLEDLQVDYSKLNEESEPAGFMCHFELLNGFTKTEYWSSEKTLAHAKRYSQTFAKYGTGLWKDSFPEMGIKTVIKNTISKWGIMSIDMQTASDNDQAVMDTDGKPSYADNIEVSESPLDGFVAAKKEVTEEPQQTEEEAALDSRLAELYKAHTQSFTETQAGIADGSWVTDWDLEQKKELLEAMEVIDQES